MVLKKPRKYIRELKLCNAFVLNSLGFLKFEIEKSGSEVF